MTDTTAPTSVHKTPQAHQRLHRRYRFEVIFKLLGALAILMATLALVALLWTVLGNAWGALTETYLITELTFDRDKIDPTNTRDTKVIRSVNFSSLIKQRLRQEFPTIKARQDKFALYALVSDGAALDMRHMVMAEPDLIGTTQRVRLLASDDADLYAKGYQGKPVELPEAGTATPTGTAGTIDVFVQSNALTTILENVKRGLLVQARSHRRDAAAQMRGVDHYAGKLAAVKTEAERAKLEAQIKAYKGRHKLLIDRAEELEKRANTAGGTETLTRDSPSVLLYLNGGVVKAETISIDHIKGQVLVPLSSVEVAQVGQWRLVQIDKSEAARKLTDKQIVWLELLRARGQLERTFNWRFFTAGDSREPEQAGVWGAIVGSFWTMLVTFALSFPVGVLAAIFLEEFAPKNRFTHFIEVNINNLAAVPSIVFGLLGLAVFLTFFGVPRSAPLAGGMVLALMTLPTIIIAGRAAIKAVPASIREAALGVGASKVQTVFHHVLPLAMPGILTGSIIGMAQALGETAPLLMIGMVAFIKDIPTGILQPASVLPVQIYGWSDFPERAFEMRTAAAILVLLAFLVVMNAIAIFLRKKFERRW